MSTTTLPDKRTAPPLPPINSNNTQSSSKPNSAANSPLSPSLSPREPRRTSFNFLRKTSQGKMSKKEKELQQEELLKQQRREATVPKMQPLPTYEPLQPFGGEDTRPDSVAIATNQVNSHRLRDRTPSQTRSMNFSRVSPAAVAPIRAPPVPAGPPGEHVDPYARTESMTHRGRYSYASSAISSVNSPRRVRRRKDPTPFNILVVGVKNSGKTSFIDFLRTALAQPTRKRGNTPAPSPPHTAIAPDSPFTSEYIETEIDNERVGVTIWDSQGLEKNVIDLQLREVSAFLESKFEETFTEEQKVVRAPGVRDTHIHCVFLVLDPTRLDINITAARKALTGSSKPDPALRFVGGLDEALDLQVLRTLQGKTTVIPVISKADTITTAHMNNLKKMVWFSLKQSKLDPLEALDFDDDEDDDDVLDERDEDAIEATNGQVSPKLNKLDDASSSEAEDEDDENSTNPSSPPRASPEVKRHNRQSSLMSATIATSPSAIDAEIPYLPLSIISPDMYEPGVVGRKFPWGFADPYNAEHCDFIRLKESVFSEWRTELREASRERWYEGWRTSRLNRKPEVRAAPKSKSQNFSAPRRSATGDANIGAARVPPSLTPGGSNTYPSRAMSAGGPVGYRSTYAPPADGFQSPVMTAQARPVTQMI